MKTEDFFEKQTRSSRIKAKIVSEYFPQYAKIISLKHKPKEIRYIDLFAGPGKYKDGNASTPILVARNCLKNEYLRRTVRFVFNDKKYYEELKQNFLAEFPVGTFTKDARFGDKTVGDCPEITDFLSKVSPKDSMNNSPSLLFIDPFGYKGIETSVLAKFLSNWGNEIFIFINSKRILPAIDNEKFAPIIKKIFPTQLSIISKEIEKQGTLQGKLNLILDNLREEFKKDLSRNVYCTFFKFQEEDIETTSHFIFHITKSKRGYDLIKTIYNDFANVGTSFDGINTYTFDSKQLDSPEFEEFNPANSNIEKLMDRLVENFKGRVIDAMTLFDEDQVFTKYCRAHYTQAIRGLIDRGDITATFNDNIHHAVTALISKNCILNFK